MEALTRIPDVDVRSLVVLAPWRQTDQATLDALGAVVVRRVKGRLGWFREARRAVLQERPDFILSHGFNAHFLVLLLLASMRASQRPTPLMTYHGEYHGLRGERDPKSVVFNGFTYWYASNVAQAILAVAGFCKTQLVQHGVEASKVTVVHNGIAVMGPVSRPSEGLRARLGLPVDCVLVAAASRLDAVKGVSHLINAFAKVASAHPRARLVVMGDGAERADLENLARKTCPEGGVIFPGAMKGVPQLLHEVDVFALPSLAEYHSIALLEAMAAGCAIVATDVGGNTESVADGVEALVVPPADVDRLAAALELVVSDASLRAALGSAARRRLFREFTMGASARSTAAWFEQVCQGLQRRRV